MILAVEVVHSTRLPHRERAGSVGPLGMAWQAWSFSQWEFLELLKLQLYSSGLMRSISILKQGRC